MSDNKRWFKVWNCILSDPGFDELPNDCAGVWVRLGALISKHGCNGNITVTKNQFFKRTNSRQSDLEHLIKNLAKIHVSLLSDCNDNITVTFNNWRKYQEFTDSYARVKKFRDKHNVTDDVTLSCNAPKEEKRGEEIRREKEEIKIKEKKRFTPPNIEEVTVYCKERENNIDPKRFIDHYTSNGWMVGKNPMKDWKAAVRTWENRQGGINGRIQGNSGTDNSEGKTGGKYSGLGTTIEV